MGHVFRYLHGVIISILAFPLVIVSGILFLCAFLLVYLNYAFSYMATLSYRSPLAPKVHEGESLRNPLSRISEKIVNLSFERV